MVAGCVLRTHLFLLHALTCAIRPVLFRSFAAVNALLPAPPAGERRPRVLARAAQGGP